MKTKHLTRLVMVSLLMAGLLVFMSPTSHAADENMDASVELVTIVTLTSIGALDFGKISIPTDIDAVWNLNGTGLSQTTSSNSATFGGSSRGEFTINADDGQEVAFGVTINTNFPGTNAPVLSALTMSVSTPQVMSGTTLIVLVGGDLAIAKTVTSGTYGATIDVTADYTP